MTEPERRAKRRPDPADIHPRRVAEGAAKVIEDQLPHDGNGLGPLGEQTLHVLLDEAKREQAEKRLPYLFQKWMRDWFDRQHPERIEAWDEVVDAHMDRRALWRLWKRVMLAAVPIGGTVFAYASGVLDKWLPLIKRFIELFKATPS